MNKMNKVFLGVAIVLVTYANGIVSTKFLILHRTFSQMERELGHKMRPIINL